MYGNEGVVTQRPLVQARRPCPFPREAKDSPSLGQHPRGCPWGRAGPAGLFLADGCGAGGGDPQLVVRQGAPRVTSVFFPSSSFHRKEKQTRLRSQDVRLRVKPGREANPPPAKRRSASVPSSLKHSLKTLSPTQKSRTTSGSEPVV